MWTLPEHRNYIVTFVRLLLSSLNSYCQSLAPEMWVNAWTLGAPEETVTDETDKPGGGGMGGCGRMQVDRWGWKTVRSCLMDGRSDTAPEPLNPGDMH